MEEIGSAEAIIYKIQTLSDGGARVVLDLGLDSQKIISKLIEKKMSAEDLVYIAFVDKGQ